MDLVSLVQDVNYEAARGVDKITAHFACPMDNISVLVQLPEVVNGAS